MSNKTLNRDQAHMKYGPAFVRMIMRGKREITITEKEDIAIKKWEMLKANHFVPFAYNYVYLFVADTGLCKVGVTNGVRERIASIRSASPVAIEFHNALLFAGDDGRNAERSIHTGLRKQGLHKKGEWYKGPPERIWEWMKEHSGVKYPYSLTSPRDALIGCEPLFDLYLAVHAEDQVQCKWVKGRRSNFLWFMNKIADGAIDAPAEKV